jgi:hypothetical protein
VTGRHREDEPVIITGALRGAFIQLLSNSATPALHDLADLLGHFDDELSLRLVAGVGLRGAMEVLGTGESGARYRAVAGACAARAAAAVDMIVREIEGPGTQGRLLEAIARVLIAAGDVADPAAGEARRRIVAAVAVHPETPIATLEALLLAGRADPADVARNPALLLLPLEPFDVLRSVPRVAMLAELPGLAKARLAIALRGGRPIQAGDGEDGARAWLDLLATLDDPRLVGDAFASSARPPRVGARVVPTLHVWLALALGRDTLAHRMTAAWLAGAPDDGGGEHWVAFTRPYFGSGEAVILVVDQVLSVLNDEVPLRRFGDALGAVLGRNWPARGSQNQHVQLHRWLLMKFLGVGGADTWPEHVAILTPGLAPTAPLTAAIRSMVPTFDVPPSRASAIALCKRLVDERRDLPREASVVLQRWARQAR